MKKITYLLFLFSILFTSCNQDEQAVLCQLTVQLKTEKNISDFSGFQISLKDLKSGETHHQAASASGTAIFSLPMGSYSLSAEYSQQDVVTYYGQYDNYTLNTSTANLELEVHPIENTLEKTFVLDELYFNGNSNGSYNYTYYEQYITIRNVSGRPLFADGLSFGVTGDFNTLEEKNEMNRLLPDVVVLSQFYTIPGDGTTYKVEPEESLVIAFSAINHNENGDKPNSLDLSGADFEIYVDGGMTPDNPEVPNVIVNFSTFQAFHWQYSGATPMVLFRLEEDANSFIEKNRQEFDNPMSSGTMQQDFIKLPSKYIIDAVETGVTDNFYHKVLPATVDKSAFLIPGTGMPGDGFYGHFIQRKVTVSDSGKTSVQDTNDSANDFELKTGGAKNYPKK